MATHGGKRQPGRPSYPDPTTRKIQKAITIAPETDAIISRQRAPGESYSATIDRLVQESTQVATARNTYQHTQTGDYWIAEGPAGGIAVTGVQGPLTADQAYPNLNGDEWPALPARPRHDAASLDAFRTMYAAGLLTLR